MTNNKRYTKQLFVDDEGEYYLDVGDIAAELGWEIGDTLVWTDNGDGSFSLAKFTKVSAG